VVSKFGHKSHGSDRPPPAESNPEVQDTHELAEISGNILTSDFLADLYGRFADDTLHHCDLVPTSVVLRDDGQSALLQLWSSSNDLVVLRKIVSDIAERNGCPIKEAAHEPRLSVRADIIVRDVQDWPLITNPNNFALVRQRGHLQLSLQGQARIEQMVLHGAAGHVYSSQAAMVRRLSGLLAPSSLMFTS